jgi:hypothetical protein
MDTETAAPKKSRWKLQVLAGLLVLAAVTGVGVFGMAGNGNSARADSAETTPTTTTTTTTTPTVGPVPASAWQPNGFDLSQVPDFIPAMSNGKVVGFVPKSQLFPTSSALQGPPVAAPSNGATPSPTAADDAAVDASSILTVYGPDLTTIIGHMYPGEVFVPVGESPPPYTAPQGQAVTAPTSPASGN